MTASAEQFQTVGVVVLPDLLRPAEVDALLAASELCREGYLASLPEDEAASATHMRHLNDHRWHASPDTWTTTLEIAADPRCLGPVESIFGEPSLFRSTTLWFDPQANGRKGDWHRDTQFLMETEEDVRRHLAAIGNTPPAERRPNGLQLQIALVETEDLEYVPYSAARNDSPEEDWIRVADGRRNNTDDRMPNALRVHLRPGDGVIFNPDGLHRGRYEVGIPRRTFMLTYTPRSAPIRDWFADQPWMTDARWDEHLSRRALAYVEEWRDVFVVEAATG